MDPKYSDTAKMSDYGLDLSKTGDYGFYNAIRAALREKEIDQDYVSGIPKEDIMELAEAMKIVQFGALYSVLV
jgi:formylmethanofuran dehydrogenase subunit B